jgi:DNA (cytosine-5)-methyltransferase 1
MAGVDVVGGVDMWDIAIRAHQDNFPGAVGYRMKAASLTPQRVREEVGQIDLLLASPECTSHSVAKGNKPACEISRATAFQVIRFAKVLQPRWIVVENVLQMQHWARFDEWTAKLQALGYRLNSRVLDSSQHGTPQTRRRLFVVADRERNPELPNRRPRSLQPASSILGRGEPKARPWAWTPLDVPGRAKATLQRAQRAFDELGTKTPFIMVYYGSDGSGGFQTLDRPLRTITTLDRFAYIRPVRGGHEMRMLQPTELAAAMGFPSYHRLPDVARREKIKMIGNAVCPRVMRDVVRQLVV